MTRVNFPRHALLTAIVLGVVVAVATDFAVAADTTAKTPNIILVFTDDQGWTDTSVRMMADRSDSASDFYRTPALERMARRGMVFSNAYSPAPVCTPSRGSVQFGKTPARLRQTVVHDALAASRGIDCRNEVSLAQMVKAADRGYVTAHFGKWGFPPRPPEHAGYDVTDGNTNNGDGDYRSVKERTPLPADDPKRIFSLTRRANAFIEAQARTGRPFFMQISHYAVHVQHGALEETVEKYKRLPPGEKSIAADRKPPPHAPNAWMPRYAAMIEDLDTGLGMLLDKLDELGIEDDTYVIFTSDNGSGFRGNAPLRGGKANLWEGGIRVPTVVCGPGVKPGAQCDVPIAGWDFFPTIADLIGSRKPLPPGIDGGSLRPLLEKGNDGRIRRGTEALVFHFPWYANVPFSAIRLGDYKLIQNLNTGEIRLFDLVHDMGEENDLSAAMPEKVRLLHATLADYLKAVDAETIDDMRAAREKELIRYTARTQGEIERLEERLKNVTTENEKRDIEQRLAAAQRQAQNHQRAMSQMEAAKKKTDW